MAYRRKGKKFGSFSNIDFHGTDLLKVFFRGLPYGDATAALKCFLYLSSYVDFDSRYSEIKYEEMMTGTGLSRPMVCRGLKVLKSMDCSLIRKGTKRSQYVLNRLTDQFTNLRFSKVPTDVISINLKMIPNKGKKARNSLIIYVYLLTIRVNSQPLARVSYDTLVDKLGISRNEIKSSLCMLYECDLVTCLPPRGDELSNRYHLRGLELTKDEFVYHPSGYNYEMDSLEQYLKRTGREALT